MLCYSTPGVQVGGLPLVFIAYLVNNVSLLTRDSQTTAPYHVWLGKMKVARTRYHYVFLMSLLNIESTCFFSGHGNSRD